MSKFRRIAIAILILEIAFVIVLNVAISGKKTNTGRQYRVDIQRAARSLQNDEEANLDEYDSIIAVKPFTDDYKTNNDYAVVSANGKLYSIEYQVSQADSGILFMNIGLIGMVAITAVVLMYIGRRVLKPFNRMSKLTTELAKGNLAAPIKEEKNKFFGKFLWSMDMLRDNLETNKEKELQLQKEKKTLILSLSHDIKTPLSAIKLYNKALKEDLYDTPEKKNQAYEGIERNITDIERYVSDIVTASKEDFLNLEATISDFYISEIMAKISTFYTEKFKSLHTEFTIDEYSSCLLKGDMDRMEEVLQNILENAIKYGDGKYVRITMDEEEDCRLICVANSGCSIKEEEIPHLFDSFYRGTNADNKKGSGLGLYICKSLMRMMDGDIFAQIDGDEFKCVVVVRKS